jgi:peptide deformylase
MAVDLSSLRILRFPEPGLRRKAQQVAEISSEVRAVVQRMIEMMHEAEGIGLAAPQVGLPWRLFVAFVHPAEGRSPESSPVTALASPRVYINPVLSAPTGAPEPYEEGCLSIPDITGEVLRPPVITISATDLEGASFTQTGAGLLARCWQHECDHLDGVLIIDRMTQLSRLKNRAALRELEKSAKARR